MLKEQLKYTIRPTTEVDIPSITSFMERVLHADPKAALAVEPVTIDTLQAWIAKGHSIVATLPDDEIIGHQAIDVWSDSGWYEVRTALVDPAFRGHGINTDMKKFIIKGVSDGDSDVTISAFTHPESTSRGILTKLDFDELPMDEVPEEFFSICDPTRCVKVTKVDCGCKVYVLKKP